MIAPKDDSEMTIVKKACQATMDLFKKYLREQIMDLIDRDKVCHVTWHMYVAGGFLHLKLMFILMYQGSLLLQIMYPWLIAL